MTNAGTVINRFGDRPVYRQLTELIEARLAQHAQPGDRLPSEADLSAEFEVNRLTVRRALHELNRRGVIDTRHGKGSFVAAPLLRYDVSAGRHASFTRNMREAGLGVRIRQLSRTVVADPEVQAQLQTTEPVLVCRTVRIVDDQPWSLSETRIGTGRFPGLTELWQGETSLYDFLLEAHGVRMQRSQRTFAAALAEPEDAERLLIRVGDAILEMRGVNVDQHGTPVAAVHHRFRGDRVQFTVDLW